MCIYVCTYVHVNMYIQIYIHTCTYVYIYICIHIGTITGNMVRKPDETPEQNGAWIPQQINVPTKKTVGKTPF